jgi:hypothetical protein
MSLDRDWRMNMKCFLLLLLPLFPIHAESEAATKSKMWIILWKLLLLKILSNGMKLLYLQQLLHLQNTPKELKHFVMNAEVS